MRGVSSFAAAGCLVTIAVTACRPTWRGGQIVTEAVAAGSFVFGERPIHPFCVLFEQEELSRHRPIPLATCADSRFLSCSVTGGCGRQIATLRVYSGYRVLARKNDRFLLALESSGGARAGLPT